MSKGKLLIAGLVGLILFAGAVLSRSMPLAGEKDKQKDGNEPPKAEAPAKYKVVKKPFQIDLEVKGTLEAGKAVEIVYRPQPAVTAPATAPLIVKKVVAHGAKVAKDDILLVLDTQRIDEVIKQLTTDKKGFDAKVKLAEEEIPILKQLMPVELAEAELAFKHADEDLKYFNKIGKPEAEKKAHQYVKIAAFFLETEKEDLRQLEKMYKSKDLTEETEKIILKRQQFWVDRMTFYFKQAEIERDYTLKVTLPRQEKLLTDKVTLTALALEKAKRTLAPQIYEKEQTLLKLRFDRDKIADQIQRLDKDRLAMTIKSPQAGIVYYGKFNQGKWTAAAEMAGKLVPEGTISPDQVLMTVVDSRPLLLRVLIDENDVHLLKPATAGKAKVPFRPDLKIPAKVDKVSSLPSEPGKYQALLFLDLPADAAKLMPGMACSVKFVPYAKKDALLIPKKAVFEEEERSFVWVLADGKKEKRAVEPGQSNSDYTEILDGLKENETILADVSDGEKSTVAAGKGEKP
jgi:multidrug efflux pump subunit AcrA (membrane-fusion protein)